MIILIHLGMHTGQTRPGLIHKTNQNLTAIVFSAGICGWVGTFVGAWYLQCVGTWGLVGISQWIETWVGAGIGAWVQAAYLCWICGHCISDVLELGASLGFSDGLELGSEQ